MVDYVSRQRPLRLCGGQHEILKCHTFRSPKERIRQATSKSICMACGEYQDRTVRCTSVVQEQKSAVTAALCKDARGHHQSLGPLLPLCVTNGYCPKGEAANENNRHRSFPAISIPTFLWTADGIRRLNIRNDYKATSLASCFQVIVRFLSSSSTLISLSNQRSLYRDIFQRIMLSANRLWHQDAKGTRPPEIRGTRAHSTPSIQPAPTTYSTFEGFFDQEGPFSVNDIKEFARLESKWPPEYLPHHVKDGAALRLFTWTARKPSPHEHLKEAIKRLPFLEKASNLRPFFTKYARTNFEPRGEGATSRCPLCASHLLGFPMADHSIQQCPLDELTGDDRLTFLAINHAGYCQRCNARSPAHYQNKCEQNKKKCPHCKQYGHTATLPLCIDDELKHLVNEDLTAKVNGIRENFLKQLREKMSNGTVFHYRLYVDSSYNFQTPSHPERLTGWKYYEDKARKFPEIQKHKYSNFHKNLEAAYPTMQPEELLKGWVQDIPFFSPLMFNYLQEIGYLVTRVRNSMKLDGRYLPPFPYENQHRSPPRQLSQEPKQSGSQPSTSGTQRPLPTRSEIPVRPWRSPPIIIPPSVQDARDLDPRRQDSSVSGSGIAQLEIFRARYRNHGMRPLTAPTTSSSSSTTNTVEVTKRVQNRHRDSEFTATDRILSVRSPIVRI
ncbi:hypothetical protein B9Z55_015227 [Caenorhabditis nigoni]|uniref:Uncharacterized protein n=1 Tax=Caenorhabditis nigoni TaxID=1611254 RepID=A0A2G5U9A7_9PELO|nr:hypothetical protein B9Z55_015227 [Caenorhabditis nigoni]